MLQRVERRGNVSRRTEIVAVQMHRVRQAELVANPSQLRHDRAGRQSAVAFDRRRQLLGVLAPLPRRHAARIDRLDAVRLRRPQIPRHDLLRPLVFALLQLVEHDFVVRHQRQRRLVDDRNVGQLFVRVAGRKHGHGRFVHRRQTHAGVEIAGGKRRGRHAAQAAAPRSWCE